MYLLDLQLYSSNLWVEQLSGYLSNLSYDDLLNQGRDFYD